MPEEIAAEALPIDSNEPAESREEFEYLVEEVLSMPSGLRAPMP